MRSSIGRFALGMVLVALCRVPAGAQVAALASAAIVEDPYKFSTVRMGTKTIDLGNRLSLEQEWRTLCSQDSAPAQKKVWELYALKQQLAALEKDFNAALLNRADSSFHAEAIQSGSGVVVWDPGDWAIGLPNGTTLGVKGAWRLANTTARDALLKDLETGKYRTGLSPEAVSDTGLVQALRNVGLPDRILMELSHVRDRILKSNCDTIDDWWTRSPEQEVAACQVVKAAYDEVWQVVSNAYSRIHETCTREEIDAERYIANVRSLLDQPSTGTAGPGTGTGPASTSLLGVQGQF